MLDIVSHTFKINNLTTFITNAYLDYYGIQLSKNAIEEEIKPFYSNFSEEIYCFLEFPYVDKVYSTLPDDFG